VPTAWLSTGFGVALMSHGGGIGMLSGCVSKQVGSGWVMDRAVGRVARASRPAMLRVLAAGRRQNPQVRTPAPHLGTGPGAMGSGWAETKLFELNKVGEHPISARTALCYISQIMSRNLNSKTNR
jgi:hypothetical protein